MLALRVIYGEAVHLLCRVWPGLRHEEVETEEVYAPDSSDQSCPMEVGQYEKNEMGATHSLHNISVYMVSTTKRVMVTHEASIVPFRYPNTRL